MSEPSRRANRGSVVWLTGLPSSDLPGVDLAYEAPEAPEIVAEGGQDAVAIARIVALLQPAREGDE
ncbi:MAG: hypothetical protein ABI134_04430 [Byssovorax sp.]